MDEGDRDTEDARQPQHLRRTADDTVTTISETAHAEVAIGHAEALIARVLQEAEPNAATLKDVLTALQDVSNELHELKTSWVGVRTDLKAPGYHMHDEVRMPMTIEAQPVRTRFEGDEAGFGWSVTYSCPQCHETFALDADVALAAETRPEGSRVGEIGWFHGSGPGGSK
jgi:hypothetical protein